MATTLISLERSVTGRITGAWNRSSRSVRGVTALAVISSCVAAGLAAPPAALAVGLLVSGLAFVAAALVDIVEHKIPNLLVAMACSATVVSTVATWRSSAIVGALLGAVVAGGSMLIVRLGRGVGMGDVKLAGAVGSSCGSVALVAAPLAIALAALGAAAFGLATGRQRLPLGPALWGGWCAALLLVQLGAAG